MIASWDFETVTTIAVALMIAACAQGLRNDRRRGRRSR